jgi:hypothetical protein
MTKVDEREPMTFEQDVLEIALESLRSSRESGLAAAPRRPRRRRMTAIAIAAAGVAIAIAIPIALPGGATGGADPAAAALLHRVALRAAQQPPQPIPGAGQYLYTRSESASTFLYVVGDGRTLFFKQPLIRASWIGLDGSGRILSSTGAVTFLTEEDRATWIAAGSPDLCADLCEGQTNDERFGPGELATRNFANLPTDPEELLELIESRELIGGPDGDWETFSIIGDLLRETSLQPKERAALYQVAAELPGVELVGRVVDGAGRPGVAVAYTRTNTDAPSRHELIFDPTTAELLGENEVLTEDSTVDVESGGRGAIYGLVGPADTLAYSTTYLVSEVVDGTSETL